MSEAASLEPEYVDDRDLEKLTKISRGTWQKWRVLGKGPKYYKFARRVVYRWREVQAWLEAHARTGAGL